MLPTFEIPTTLFFPLLALFAPLHFTHSAFVSPATTCSKGKKKGTSSNLQRLPERGVLTPALHSLDKTMESNKNRSQNNERMETDEQESLFIDENNPAPNNPCTWSSPTQLLASSDDTDDSILELGYSKSFQCIALYLTTLQKTTGLTTKAPGTGCSSENGSIS